jgi:hypothetical protein
MGKRDKEEPEEEEQPDAPQLNLSDALIDVDNEKSELDKVFKQLLDPNNIAHNTELDQEEITAFSVLAGLAEQYDLTTLKRFLLDNLQLRVSKGRKGRNEIVRITARNWQDPQKPTSIWDRFRRD